MTETQKCQLVLLYAPIPTIARESKTEAHNPASETAKYKRMADEFDRLFNEKFSSGDFYRIGPGAFLVDEDACYPGVRDFMKLAEDHKLRHLLLPLADSSLSLSPDYQGLQEWLKLKGKSCRLTRLQTPEPAKTP